MTERDTGRRRRPTVGILLIAAGIVLLLVQLVPGFTAEHLWPVLMILAGAWLLLGVRRPPPRRDP